jgi:phosphatidylglycerol:prolipoprotein diacylglycerol transferase
VIAASCWTWDIDPIILKIYGPIQLRWYGLCFLGVFLGGWWMLRWQLRRAEALRAHPGAADELAGRFINYGVIGTLAGAWFGHRFFYEPAKILENPMYLIDVSGGLAGLSSHGAAAGLMVAIVLFARKYRIPVGEVFDRFVFAMAPAVSLVRLGNFFNSEVVGRPADVDWAVCLARYDCPPDGVCKATQELVARHPSQLYEALIGVGLLIILVLADRWAGKEKRPRWLMFGVFTIFYAITRFVIEYFKNYQALTSDASALTMGQYLSIPLFLLGCTMTWWAMRQKTAMEWSWHPPAKWLQEGASSGGGKRTKKKKRRR